MSQTLLVADDSVTIQRVFELTFADEDIQVIAVGDGQQAIDQIKADPPDIVLADTGMPERDGYDVATFIKADPALAHIPVVLLTGAFEPVDEDRERQAGCAGVLVRPFEPQVVIDRVRELLGTGTTREVPATTSGPVMIVPHEAAAADDSTRHAETPGRSTHDPDGTFDLSTRLSAGDPEPAPRLVTNDRALAPDDPLGDGLERMEEAFDRFEAAAAVASGQRPTAADKPRPVPEDTLASKERVDSPDGALSGREEPLDERVGTRVADAPAEHAVSPSIPVAASPPPERSVAEPVPASVTLAPPAASVTAPPSPEPVASAPAPEPVPPQAPVDTPPSLADAFASLLAAEEGGAERAQTVYPWPRPGSSPVVNEELIDRVAERVVARLSNGVTSDLVAEVVARVAEQLVRKEINRNK